MMIEKTYGQAARMGTEWKPAGIISRMTAELLTKEKVNAIPQPGSLAQPAQPSQQKGMQRSQGTASAPALENAGNQQNRRVVSDSDHLANAATHRTDWHLMS